MPEKLVAVVVTFNRLEKLRTALEHTLGQGFYRVVVVDNCSTDGTADWLAGLQAPELVVLRNARNLGGAGGFHRGFDYAARELPEAQWLVCFDDDAYPEADVVAQFEALQIPPQVGSLGAAVYLPDGRISEMNRPSRNPFWHLREFFGAAGRGRHGFHLGDGDYHSAQPVSADASSFVGCFIRLDLVREGAIGLPRAELFIYADDIIYLLQLRRAGFQHWFVPNLRFVHDCATLVNQLDVYRPLWKVYYTYRNRLELYRIASGWFYPLILLVKIPGFFLSVRHYEPHERGTFLRVTARAVWDGVLRNYRKTHEQVLGFSRVEAQP
ncbi:glycosyltransferase [Mangrovimicrobium sediminis]|uniref:Glycosyltransferase n=1 Tax=Mangrovimicrobium sediminis TaxID=2562682 RepID=A0A4Z0LZ98_9GAMM|nr:glycosyltransferase [Haliea sp. SAOS-164]TGD72487.1 glycosyltransferase [Haliea sp. SAOS-164]